MDGGFGTTAVFNNGPPPKGTAARGAAEGAGAGPLFDVAATRDAPVVATAVDGGRVNATRGAAAGGSSKCGLPTSTGGFERTGPVTAVPRGSTRVPRAELGGLNGRLTTPGPGDAYSGGGGGVGCDGDRA